MEIEGKRVLITGASRGLGRALVSAFLEAGAGEVLAGARKHEDLEALKSERVTPVRLEVRSDEDVEAIARIGAIDILVNNAGAYDFKPLEEVTETEFHREFNTNVLGLILATQEAAKHFGADGGSVINVSSVASSATPPNSAIYTATKGAVDAITRVLAKELGPRKIRINAVNPGPIETEGFHAIGIPGSDFEKQMVAQTPLGRIGQPRDVAPVVAFLASSESEWITGETIRVAGGFR